MIINGQKKSSRGSLISERNNQNSQKTILDNSKLNEEPETNEIQSLQSFPHKKKSNILPRNHSSTIQTPNYEFSKENKKSFRKIFEEKSNLLQLENENKPNNKRKSISNIGKNVETPTFDPKLKCDDDFNKENHLNPSLKNIPEESAFLNFQEKKHSSMIFYRNEFLDESVKFDSDYSGNNLSQPEEEFIFSETVLGKKEVWLYKN